MAKKKKTSGGDRIDGDGERAFVGAVDGLVVSVGQLRRHPENRIPSDASVDSMAGSLQADGQIEPLLVRPLPREVIAGRPVFQIISGETRWLAAKQIGLESLLVRVVEATDPRALELMAVCNAQRVDLDPIEKARLIDRLSDPVELGGAGLTREAAARIYGLESGSAASNLVRLLELPEEWRQRVASGVLPQSIARLLLPYVEAPRIMAAISASWEKAQDPQAKEWDRDDWATREAAEREIEDVVAGATRPIDGKTPISYSSKELGTYDHKGRGRLFKLTPELRADLDVVKVKIDGKVLEVATNVERFDAEQIPLVKAAIAKSRKNAKPQPLEPQDPEAAARESAKAQAEKLAERVKVWQVETLRGRLAAALEEPLPKQREKRTVIVERLLIATILGDAYLAGDLSGAMLESIPSGLRSGLGGPASDLSAAWSTIGKLTKVDQAAGPTLIASAFAVVLRQLDDPRWPRFPLDFLEQLADDLGLGGVAALWSKLTPDERGEFYDCHTVEQLVALAGELGVYVPDGKSKATIVEMLLGKGGRCPVPKILGGVKVKRKQTKKGGK
jgi:ParB/RepB/Spo0J family partition protein